MLLYYVFLELGSGTCEASASSMLREGDWDHIRDMIQSIQKYKSSDFKLALNSKIYQLENLKLLEVLVTLYYSLLPILFQLKIQSAGDTLAQKI